MCLKTCQFQQSAGISKAQKRPALQAHQKNNGVALMCDEKNVFHVFSGIVVQNPGASQLAAIFRSVGVLSYNPLDIHPPHLQLTSVVGASSKFYPRLAHKR